MQIVADVFEHERNRSGGVGLRCANPTYEGCQFLPEHRRLDWKHKGAGRPGVVIAQWHVGDAPTAPTAFTNLCTHSAIIPSSRFP